jgi:hypothetical protein
MYNLWKNFAVPGAVCVYSDTDSIITQNKNLRNNAEFELDGRIIPVIGKEMGQLELEYVFSDFITVGKKQYIGKYFDKKEQKIKYKKRFKGIPYHFITPELYTHLLISKENYAQIDFLKFKREWGCVKGYIESKQVTQT